MQLAKITRVHAFDAIDSVLTGPCQVNNLGMQTEVLDQGLIKPEYLAKSLSAEVRALLRLIEDFQQLAESDAGPLRIRPQRLPLEAMIEELLLPLAATVKAAAVMQIPVGWHVCVAAQVADSRLLALCWLLWAPALNTSPEFKQERGS